jgi:hypothetical protein
VILPARKRKNVGHDHPKTDIVVPVVRLVPVAGGAAGVVFIVIESAAPQHPVSSACAYDNIVAGLF